MCLPDGAEYWWDVKGYNSKPKHVFTHIKDVACGHYHVIESVSVSEIDCRACKKILAEIPEIKEALLKKYDRIIHPHGKCNCGASWVKRVNKITKEKFLGCGRYPKCKNTKVIDNTLNS